MFSGEYEHSIDKKGRIIVPAKFRFELKESFWINRGMDGCITIHTQEDWMKRSEQLEELSDNSREAREFNRQMFRLAYECSVDNQGRITISQKLIQLAGIKKDCVFVGVNRHIELWDVERWNAYNESVDSLEELAERLPF